MVCLFYPGYKSFIYFYSCVSGQRYIENIPVAQNASGTGGSVYFRLLPNNYFLADRIIVYKGFSGYVLNRDVQGIVFNSAERPEKK